eukprot:6723747-Alexandrium_andersonii.AAC.1
MRLPEFQQRWHSRVKMLCTEHRAITTVAPAAERCAQNNRKPHEAANGLTAANSPPDRGSVRRPHAGRCGT